jgi:hypothetical protein
MPEPLLVVDVLTTDDSMDPVVIEGVAELLIRVGSLNVHWASCRCMSFSATSRNKAAPT